MLTSTRGNVNRLLLLFRDHEFFPFESNANEFRAVMFLANPITLARLVPNATPEEWAHAEKVLARLVRLTRLARA